MENRIVIVDFNPLVHQYLRGGAPRLSHIVTVNGEPMKLDTTIPNYTSKAIHRWSNRGKNPVAVCFDSPCPSRKEYFKRLGLKNKIGEDMEYKDGRNKFTKPIIESIELTAGYLMKSGVSVYKQYNYEADDLVFACVQRAKEQYSPANRALTRFYTDKLTEVLGSALVIHLPVNQIVTKLIKAVRGMNLPKQSVLDGMIKMFQVDASILNKCVDIFFDAEISNTADNYVKENIVNFPIMAIDIICNDVDYFPLVDDQVSVFYRTSKQTWAKEKSLEKRGYIQVMPDNIESVMHDISQYKTLNLPYNTVLLAKLLRGDKSDNIPVNPEYPPRVFNQLIGILQNNVDCASVFRYGDESQMQLIKSTLSKYIDDEDVDFAMKIARGINLNCEFKGLGAKYDRKPAVITTDINSYSAGVLAKNLGDLAIHIDV